MFAVFLMSHQKCRELKPQFNKPSGPKSSYFAYTEIITFHFIVSVKIAVPEAGPRRPALGIRLLSVANPPSIFTFVSSKYEKQGIFKEIDVGCRYSCRGGDPLFPGFSKRNFFISIKNRERQEREICGAGEESH